MPGYVHDHPDRPPHRSTRQARRAPAARRAARAGRRAPRARRRRRRAPRPLRRLRRRSVSRRARAGRGVHARSATTPTRAPSRSSSRSPDRVPIRCDHEGGECPGSPWQPLRYERQLQYKHELVEDALTADRRLRGLRDGADRARRRSVALPQQDGVHVWRSPRSGRLALGFHARGRWDTRQRRARLLLASERNNAVRNFVRDWCAAQGLSAYDRRAQEGLLRNLVVREGRNTGDLQVRLVTSPGDFDVDALGDELRAQFPDASFLWTRIEGPAGSTHGGVDRGRHRRGALPRAPRRPRVQHLAGGLLPDQHRDGGAALRPRRRVRRRWPGPSASTTSSAASARSA